MNPVTSNNLIGSTVRFFLGVVAGYFGSKGIDLSGIDTNELISGITAIIGAIGIFLKGIKTKKAAGDAKPVAE